MRLTLINIFILMTYYSYSQEKIELKNQDGVYISYELTKLSKTSDSKDKYLFTIKAENRNDYSVYYEVEIKKTKIGDKYIESVGNKSFADINARNSIGFLSSSVEELIGQETKLITTDNKMIFTIPKNEFVSTESKFTFKKDETPIVTCSFLKSLRKLEFFDIPINEQFINGDWISNCGGINMSLAIIKNSQNEIILQQTVNGKINDWKKINSNSFEKVNDKNVTLTYNKQNQSLTYSTSDGISCNWIKK